MNGLGRKKSVEELKSLLAIREAEAKFRGGKDEIRKLRDAHRKRFSRK